MNTYIVTELQRQLEARDKEIAGLIKALKACEHKALKAHEHTAWFIVYRDAADWNGGRTHNDTITVHPVAWRATAKENGREVTLLFFTKVPRQLADNGFVTGGYHHQSGSRKP